MKSLLDDPELRDKLMGCYVFGEVGELPACSTAAIAYLARFAGVTCEDCTEPECDHPRLPPGYADGVRIGTPVAAIIVAIEQLVAEALGRRPEPGPLEQMAVEMS